MPDANTRAAPAAPARAAGDHGGPMAELSSLGMRLLFLFVVYNIIMGFKSPETMTGTGTGTGTGIKFPAGLLGGSAPKVQPKIQQQRLKNAWGQNVRYSMKMFFSEESALTKEAASEKTPDWEFDDLTYNKESSNTLNYETNMTLPEDFINGNQSMYMHFFLTPEAESAHLPVVEGHFNLVEWRPVKKRGPEMSLLGKQEDTPELRMSESSGKKDTEATQTNPHEDEDEQPWKRFWKPDVSIHLITDWAVLGTGAILPEIEAEFKRLESTDLYVPLLVMDEFWLLKENHIEANKTVDQVPLKLTFAPQSLWKHQLYSKMNSLPSENIGTLQDSDLEELKRIMIDTNPYLLGTTVFVTMAHTVLEMLAFRSDITHWRSVKSMEGISVRSLFWQVGVNVIIFLYLLDNDTSWMVLIGAGVSVLIEVWKLGKAVRIKSFGQRKLLGFIPWIELEEKESYSQSETKKYDDMAMKYLSFIMYPCVVAYAIYSLIYEKHRSWYSWFISFLVGAVYSFGFIMMFPQVYINYKLKSVAHLPMKAFMYKALNTVIDDLFSFIIKMPTMHRLACFRDDIVFAIFLYQRWKYPVDKSRVNEFGQVFENDKRTQKSAKAGKKDKKKAVSSSSQASRSTAEPAQADVPDTRSEESKNEEEKKND